MRFEREWCSELRGFHLSEAMGSSLAIKPDQRLANCALATPVAGCLFLLSVGVTSRGLPFTALGESLPRAW